MAGLPEAAYHNGSWFTPTWWLLRCKYIVLPSSIEIGIEDVEHYKVEIKQIA